MKNKVIISSILSLMLGMGLMYVFTVVTSDGINATIFDENVKVEKTGYKDVILMIDKNIENYASTVENVSSAEYKVTINGTLIEDYHSYNEDIYDFSIDVFEFVEVTAEEPIPFEVVKEEDYGSPRGTEYVSVEGVDGTLQTFYTIVYRNGVEHERTNYNEKIIPATNQVLRVGMADVNENGSQFGLNGEYPNEKQCNIALEKINEENKVNGIETMYICIESQSGDGSYNLKLIQ